MVSVIIKKSGRLLLLIFGAMIALVCLALYLTQSQEADGLFINIVNSTDLNIRFLFGSFSEVTHPVPDMVTTKYAPVR